MTISAKIDAVAAGTDTTNPYQPYIDGLDALIPIASAFSFINDDIGGPEEIPIDDAIVLFDAAVVLFNETIRKGDTTGLTEKIENHWNTYWNGTFQNYKNRPTLLAAADGIRADVLTADALPPVDPALTWSTIGSQTWSDDKLTEYGTNVTSISDILATIVDGTVTLESEVTSETVKIDSATTAVAALISPFTTGAAAEETAYNESLTYVNAFAYVNTLESNPTDPKIQEIAAKFSGNLPV
jgi:hypothetical protein